MRSSEAGLFLAVALVSAALVGLVRALAVSHGMIQHPTHRGSHDIPTPRGGGLGVVIAIVGAFMILQTASSDPFVLACVAAGVAVAVVGWLDDRGGLSVRARLIVHVLAGITVGALAVRDTSPAIVTVALFGWWAFWTVSSINLVNFMDGINGLVASQVAIFGASLMLFSWQDATSSWYAAAIAAGCVGFLPWNFPRARIFLGDVGSGALGFLVPFIAILVMLETGIDVVSAHLPLLPLFGDATVTIVRRWRLGEKLTTPHRSHLYQRLANGGFGHTRVTLLYACASVGGAIVAHRGGRSL
ncbi:MAG: glycosyltransferase family 4 protein, partial [Gemmatimonadaceae bacterium]